MRRRPHGRNRLAATCSAILLATTLVAGSASAQEDGPPPSTPPDTAAGTVEMELVEQSFDLSLDGTIELTYRLSGDLGDLVAPEADTTDEASDDETPSTDAPPDGGDTPPDDPPLSDVKVAVINYDPLDDPDDLAGLLGPDPRLRRFPPVVDGVDLLDVRAMIEAVDVGDGDGDAEAIMRLEVPTDTSPSVAEQLEFSDPGIHPLLVQLRVDDQVVASHGTVVEVDDGEGEPPPPIDLALIGTVDDPGPLAEEAAFDERLLDLEALLDDAELLDEPMALLIPPSVARRLDDTTRTAVADTLADEEVLATPATPFDVSSAASVDRTDAFVRQFNAGENVLLRTLGVGATRDVWVANEPVSGDGARVLRDLGVRYLAMPPDVYRASVASDPFDELPDRDRFVEVTLPDGTTMPILLLDDETGATFEPATTAQVLAEQTPQEWAVEAVARWRLDQDDRTPSRRDVGPTRLISTPDLGAFDTTLVEALEDFAASSDALRFRPASALTSVTGTGPTPDGAALPDVAGPSLDERLERIAVVEADLADTATMLTDDDPRPTEWSDLLDSFVSTSFDDASVNRGLDELTAEAARIRSGIVAPPEFTFTLTGRTGSIPLVIGNELDEPVDVLVTFSSPRLTFPDGDVSVTLPADDSVELDVRVVALTNGTSSITVEIVTPGARRALIEPVRLTSRVNALTGLGPALTAGFVLVLASWWISNWRSRRRERDAELAAATHPSAGNVEPAQG